MKKKKGNDLTINWRILTRNPDGTSSPYNLEGKNLTLMMTTSSIAPIYVADFSVVGNVVTWTFWGKDQSRFGNYIVTLIENNGDYGMISIDKCDAFTLVEHSRDEDRECNCSHIDIESVWVESTVGVLPESAFPDTIARKAYVDEELAKKQDLLTPGDGIDITGNVISVHQVPEDEIVLDEGRYTPLFPLSTD